MLKILLQLTTLQDRIIHKFNDSSFWCVNITLYTDNLRENCTCVRDENVMNKQHNFMVDE